MSESIPNPKEHHIEKIDNNFYFRFSAEDQKAMRSGVWEYKNPEWILNKWKIDLESRNDDDLPQTERENKWHALWLWYHHASQFAYQGGENALAIEFIDNALAYREKTKLENDITPLLKLLYLGEFDKAKEFAKTIPVRVMEPKPGGGEKEIDNPEKETAQFLIEVYEKEAKEN